VEVAVNNLSEAVSIKVIIGLSIIAVVLWPLSIYVEFFSTNYYLDIARVFVLAVICWLVINGSLKYALLKNAHDALQRKLSIQDVQISKAKDNAVIEAKKLSADFQAKQKIAADAIAILEEKLLSVEALLAEKTIVDVSAEIMTRQYFDMRFESEWQRAYRNQRLLSVLLIDIDDFSAVNLQHGVEAGDELLQMVAAILAETIARVSDVAARFDGDQFVVILPETDIDGAGAVAEKFRQRVASAVMVNDDVEVSLTVSIGGLSVLPSAPQSWKGALIKLNEALGDAKAAGKNTVKFSGVKGLYTP
jgi:diguanylate cyclase (GGDEF)-like protein